MASAFYLYILVPLTRGVGTGGARGAGPTKFCQVPFFREQSALFLREKCH
jgi:hypothetical protein